MLVKRERQLRDEPKSGGTQPADISVINRRKIDPAPFRVLDQKPHQNPHRGQGVLFPS
jgi:hypothetical protein